MIKDNVLHCLFYLIYFYYLCKMEREQYKREFDQILTDRENQRKILENRIENLLRSAGEELGNYFITKGFVHASEKNQDIIHDYYYDRKTSIGFKVIIPTIYLGSNSYNVLTISPVYNLPNISKSNRLHNIYLYSKFFYLTQGNTDFAFMKEEPENVYNRFMRKYMNRQEMKKTENFMTEKFPKEMKMLKRKIKLEEINKKAKD